MIPPSLQTIDPAASASLAVNDKETFLRLLTEHGGIIRKVAATYSNNLADRHDLMQEITLQLWKGYRCAIRPTVPFRPGCIGSP